MRIIVAYDGSPGSEAALDEVIRRPWPPGTEVRVVSVIEPPVAYASTEGMAAYGPVFEDLYREVREKARTSAIRAVERLRGRTDLAVGYELREPGVKRALLDAIHDFGADLVILGSHGTTAVGRLFLGSVAHALVSHAPCNVEVVKIQVAA
jgi:nucleotide-binding universal stress UspA family protein